MSNNRIYYAMQQAGLKGDVSGGSYRAIRGLQSVGMTTNFPLDQVRQLGALSIYENIEDLPEIEVALNKVLDGSPLMYHLASLDATTPTLVGRAPSRSFFALSIFDETKTSATGTPVNVAECSGMYFGNVRYSFPLDGNYTEELTMMGNDKLWKTDARVLNTSAQSRQSAISFDGAFPGNSSPTGLGGVNRRENMIFGYTASGDCTLLPTEIPGINVSGVNVAVGNTYAAHIGNINVSANINRERILEQGKRGPYCRNITFPVEITCDIEVTSTSGDAISATEDGIRTTGTTQCGVIGNLVDQYIRIATCEGTRISLGSKNKLSSVSQNGGDTGGGNVTTTYTYTTQNDFVVLHQNDPHASGATWWTNRYTYLGGN